MSTSPKIPTVKLASGASMPVVGLGTWKVSRPSVCSLDILNRCCAGETGRSETSYQGCHRHRLQTFRLRTCLRQWKRNWWSYCWKTEGRRCEAGGLVHMQQGSWLVRTIVSLWAGGPKVGDRSRHRFLNLLVRLCWLHCLIWFSSGKLPAQRCHWRGTLSMYTLDSDWIHLTCINRAEKSRKILDIIRKIIVAQRRHTLMNRWRFSTNYRYQNFVTFKMFLSSGLPG